MARFMYHDPEYGLEIVDILEKLLEHGTIDRDEALKILGHVIDGCRRTYRGLELIIEELLDFKRKIELGEI